MHANSFCACAVLAELEACSYRNKSHAETLAHITPIIDKKLKLSANSSAPSTTPPSQDARLRAERQKDHYSHFILRLAFASTEDLRARFVRLETMLFKLRYQTDDAREKAAFVDWTRVPELVERRNVFLRKGKAYVPSREQMSMVVAEFTARLKAAMELTARALPRLDEDDRLAPILDHLSKNFGTSDSLYLDGEGVVPGSAITADSIDALSVHFPLCMRWLHIKLRKEGHLKHFGRLQYTLFLKGIGLPLDEAIIFWRKAFFKHTDDEFNKQYKYNIRHAYGDVGGDANRRGKGPAPFSCQRILSDNSPGVGQTHGCPYRHFSVENLMALLQSTGVNDPETLRGVREDVAKQRYHIACNRVFEYTHRDALKKVKEEGLWDKSELDTIVHPNTYFKRSYLLGQLMSTGEAGAGAGMGCGSCPMAGTGASRTIKREGNGDADGDVKMEEN
ncbi:DNA primase large subunit [Ascosphaera apis ARSEF 7405]|uniref:DNA primase large subunit n=1 Tax=Ascosphaera apis ARSEF 7405 TaxID=392613 RepID=A0A167XBN4_9EURO|nr:DNA primase large subunit [Ascosphaera apis ARSEF 7405]